MPVHGFVPLPALWLPIVLSAVIVFLASSIIHMVLPYHRSNYAKLPEEDRVREVLRNVGIKRGLYIFPFGTHQEMKSPELQEKFKQGPVGMMTVLPTGPINMGKFLGQWFIYLLVVGLFTAYVACHTVPAGTHYLGVFRVVGTVAFMAYGLGLIHNGIWGGQPWRVVFKQVFDGLIYGLLTAGTFGWLWPR
jgi:hypothetical protein